MIHCYPLNDVREHDTEHTTCWCGPRVEFRDPVTGEWYAEGLVLHRAGDHREIVEEAEKILGSTHEAR